MHANRQRSPLKLNGITQACISRLQICTRQIVSQFWRSQWFILLLCLILQHPVAVQTKDNGFQSDIAIICQKWHLLRLLSLNHHQFSSKSFSLYAIHLPPYPMFSGCGSSICTVHHMIRTISSLLRIYTIYIQWTESLCLCQTKITNLNNLCNPKNCMRMGTQMNLLSCW